MDFIFNELSFAHLSESVFRAKELMTTFINCCSQLQERQFQKLAVRPDFFRQMIATNYSISSWLDDPSVSHNDKDFLLSIYRYPYILNNAEEAQEHFISSTYYLNENECEELNGEVVEGLAVAFIYRTISVSIRTHIIWSKTQISLKRDEIENPETVKHISDAEDINIHQEWIGEVFEPVLLQSVIPPDQKRIHIPGHHGIDVLMPFARKLILNSYVNGIVNSVAFQGKTKNVIKDKTDNGIVEIILTETDEGFGLVVQTTGRNIHETSRIAQILKDEFS